MKLRLTLLTSDRSQKHTTEAELALGQMVQAGHRWYQCNPRAINSQGELVEPQLQAEFLRLAAVFYDLM